MARPIAPEVLCVGSQTRDMVLCPRAILAHGLRGRMRGLLGRSQLSSDEGTLFEAEPMLLLIWMHRFFMTFPIDLVLIGRGGVALKNPGFT
jgi:uncharacterized membrane protein (UPF0127 family)